MIHEGITLLHFNALLDVARYELAEWKEYLPLIVADFSSADEVQHLWLEYCWKYSLPWYYQEI